MTVEALEAAHGAMMRVIPNLERAKDERDLSPVARAIEACLGALYDAADGRRDPLQALTEASVAATQAHNMLRDAGGLLATVASDLDKAIASIAEAQAAAAVTRPAVEHAKRLRASSELPQLHATPRASLVPAIRVVSPPAPPEESAYEPLPSPTTFDELETWGQRASQHVKEHLAKLLGKEAAPSSPPKPKPNGESRFNRRWARECFEEVAMLASQRRPLLGEDWRTGVEIEQRMLWTLDAFVSLGPEALGDIERLVLDAPAPDPLLAYAAGFVLGSVEGRDALGMAERVARVAGDEIALHHFGEALAVIPHPHWTSMLGSWLAESNPVFRSVAARVLVARGAATQKQLYACAEDRPEIAVHAILPLTLARDPRVDEHLYEALQSSHPDLREAAWLCTAVRSRPQAAEHLRGHIDGPLSARAAPLLAAVGNRDDAERMCEHALKQPSEPLLDAVGASGHIGAVEGLMQLLDHEDPDVALAAAAALERITGAELRRDVDIPPEKLDDSELIEPDTGGFGGPSLGELVSDPRDQPSDGSADTVELPPPDRETWRAWWEQNRERFDSSKRYRMGQPFSALVAWSELDGPTLSYSQRKRSGNELLALLREHVGFSVDAFVVRQRQALVLWRPAAEKRIASAGAWAS